MREIITLALALYCLFVTSVARADDADHWVVTIHAKGKEVNSVAIPEDSELNKEIESLKKKCIEKSVLDLNTYAPSVRIENDLEQFDIGARTVVYSTRKSVNAVWNQKSRKADADDKRLREKLCHFFGSEDSKKTIQKPN